MVECRSFYKLIAFAVVTLLALINSSVAADISNNDDDEFNYAYESIYDPYEDINREIYDFNKALDTYFLAPIVYGYRAVVPEIGRQGISNALDNISEPVTFVNAIFQGDAEYAATTFWRFTINSTLGAAGIMDVASAAGMEERTEDFGQTLGVYGVKPGAYIMLPFFGPSNVRDTGGRVVDALSNPLIYGIDDDALLVYKAIDIVNGRDQTLDLTIEIERTSLDPYAALRSLYMQNRGDRIRNGTPRAPALD